MRTSMHHDNLKIIGIAWIIDHDVVKFGKTYGSISMKAAVLEELHSPVNIHRRDDLSASPGHAVIALKTAALNRRDYWITQGLYPKIKLPVVLGSDGAGIVLQTGDGVDATWKGKEIILQSGINWGDREEAQAPEFEVLGMPRDGTFATHILVPEETLHEKPPHLSWEESAALPLAGLTAWRSVFTQGGLKKGQTVLITGVGGGVALVALQFAVAAGAEVWVTSSSEDKIERAVQCGAKGGFLYTDENWGSSMAQKAGAPDLIVDSAGGKTYNDLIDLIKPGGRIVNYGSTLGNPQQINMFKLFWKQIRLQGSSLGSPADFRDMMSFVQQHQLKPIVDAVYPLEDVNKALERMKHSEQFGKIVLHCA